MPIIAIDAGHGMKTAGKRCLKSIDPNQTREWWLNDRIADRLEALLAGYDCKIVRVDDTTGAKDISMAARVKTANSANADFYISIHHNAGIKPRLMHTQTTANGTASIPLSQKKAGTKSKLIQPQDISKSFSKMEALLTKC